MAASYNLHIPDNINNKTLNDAFNKIINFIHLFR